MYRVMYKSDAQYVSCRAGVYYYTRRVPIDVRQYYACLLYTSPSPRDVEESRMPSSA